MPATEWSDWKWSPEYGKYYRARIDENGQRHFHWNEQGTQQQSPPTTNAQLSTPFDTPRTPHYPGTTNASSSRVLATSPDPERAYTHQRIDSHHSQQHLNKQVQSYVEDTNQPRDSVARRQSGTHQPYHPQHPPISEEGSFNVPPPPRVDGFIRSTDPGEAEQLDARFRKVSAGSLKAFFCPGRVFMMLWTEPAGDVAGGRKSSHYTQAWLNAKVYSEIRRFVVIANRGLHSTCIPIQTYNYKGAIKSSVRTKDHTIVYTEYQGSVAPQPVDGEKKWMTKTPIRMCPINTYPDQENLHPTSRINFGKIYTVEHNVRVLGLGKIHQDDMYLLLYYYKNVNEVS